MIDDSETEFGNTYEWFKKGEVVGIGLIRQSNLSMECFATLNGKFLGKIFFQINKVVKNFYCNFIFPD